MMEEIAVVETRINEDDYRDRLFHPHNSFENNARLINDIYRTFLESEGKEACDRIHRMLPDGSYMEYRVVTLESIYNELEQRNMETVAEQDFQMMHASECAYCDNRHHCYDEVHVLPSGEVEYGDEEDRNQCECDFFEMLWNDLFYSLEFHGNLKHILQVVARLGYSVFVGPENFDELDESISAFATKEGDPYLFNSCQIKLLPEFEKPWGPKLFAGSGHLQITGNGFEVE